MIPLGLTAKVSSDWGELARSTGEVPAFGPELVSGLPDPARRWLTHAIAPGAPLATSALVRMHGHIRLGTWRPFTAVQRLTPLCGFVWAASARLLGLPITGFDRYTRGAGQMRWRLAGLVPVMSATGSDVTRSASGRHAAELLLYVPQAALSDDVRWSTADDDEAVARFRIGSVAAEITLAIGPNGELTALTMPRWGKPDRESFGEYTFGATFEEEVTFGGITLPKHVTAGWHCRTPHWADGQFLRYAIDEVSYA